MNDLIEDKRRSSLFHQNDKETKNLVKMNFQRRLSNYDTVLSVKWDVHLHCTLNEVAILSLPSKKKITVGRSKTRDLVHKRSINYYVKTQTMRHVKKPQYVNRVDQFNILGKAEILHHLIQSDIYITKFLFFFNFFLCGSDQHTCANQVVFSQLESFHCRNTSKEYENGGDPIEENGNLDQNIPVTPFSLLGRDNLVFGENELRAQRLKTGKVFEFAQVPLKVVVFVMLQMAAEYQPNITSLRCSSKLFWAHNHQRNIKWNAFSTLEKSFITIHFWSFLNLCFNRNYLDLAVKIGCTFMVHNYLPHTSMIGNMRKLLSFVLHLLLMKLLANQSILWRSFLCIYRSLSNLRIIK
ncbi:hypothetical protein EGR_07744 [Echinococcus granulosus]|uniref:Uncharacterized protein n=1 Tax=Echinococcus granulosus TaxID=6210 RepID=W6U8B4_ECHGR|nr:hypothetical protein EGR_07744 [Echinococcus granulosus]EUB57420.1 hypothetical protein EGR_07744 [Echinococcus granulosus]